MKKLFITLFTLHSSLFALLVTGCRQDNYATFSGMEQGTTYRIVVRNPGEGLGERIDALFDTIDNAFSMFNPASLTSRINRGETDLATPLFGECFAIAQNVYALSGGYYDITVKPLVDAWGFGPGELQQVPDVKALMEYVGMDKVRIAGGRVAKDDTRLQLDFSSVAKGFTVDRLAGMLEEEGVSDYMVEVGGEVRTKGINASGNPWRIGIDRPVAGLAREIEAVVTPTPVLTSIATSGNYRNRFTDEEGRMRVHTIDPLTGEPVQGDVLSVSIAAAECAVADAWATALMAAHNIETVRGMFPPAGVEYYIMYSGDTGDMEVLRSPGFPLAEL